MDCRPFDKLFSMSVPHILEKIFFSLDYESYKNCLEVSNNWNELLKSISYQEKGKSVFRDELNQDQGKLWSILMAKTIAEGNCLLTRKYLVTTRNASKFKKILSSGMLDVNSTGGPYHGTIYAATPLVQAAINGDKVLVEILLQNGAEPNQSCGDGRTPLHVAAARDHKDVIEILLDQGGDPDTVDGDGNTPLYDAASWGHKGVVELLLNRGADPSISNQGGETPLSKAQLRGYTDIVELLRKEIKRNC